MRVPELALAHNHTDEYYMIFKTGTFKLNKATRSTEVQREFLYYTWNNLFSWLGNLTKKSKFLDFYLKTLNWLMKAHLYYGKLSFSLKIKWL